MTDSLTNIVTLITDIEEKYVAYLFKNNLEIYLLPKEYIFTYRLRIILESIQEIIDKKLSFELGFLHHLCLRKDPDITLEYLKNLSNIVVDSINIEYIRNKIKDNYIQHQVVKQIEEMFVLSTSKDSFSLDKLGNNLEKIFSCIYQVKERSLLSMEDLVKYHIEVIKERREGKRKKTIGYEVIDKKLTKPGAPEEMTLLIGIKGSGKSILCKCIENNLISEGVCVLSVNLEMSKENCQDRLFSIRYGYSFDDLMNKEKNERLDRKISIDHEKMIKIKNYISYTEPEINIAQLDGLIYQSKMIFKERGLLPEDEYIFIAIDLLDLIEEFGNSDSPYKIKSAINKLHRIVRKHKCHMLILHQANENKIRGGKIFKKSEELDYYKIGLEDIEGGASLAARSRVVMTITRPLQMKKRFFPEEMERWNLETDFINLNIVKQNDGPEGYLRFIFGSNFRIYPFVDDLKSENNESKLE